MDPELFVWDPDLGKIEKRDLNKNSKLYIATYSFFALIVQIVQWNVPFKLKLSLVVVCFSF